MQEIGLANEDAIVVCGEESISWTLVRDTVGLISGGARVEDLKLTKIVRMLRNVPPSGAEDVGKHIFYLCGNLKGSSFDRLILATMICECENLRDRVYGLLALFDPSQITLQANYNLTVPQVYQEATMNLIANTKSLDVLRLCVLDSKDSGDQRPSWVPDYSRRSRPAALYSPNPAWTTYLNTAPLIDGDLLEAKGVHVGTIKTALPHEKLDGNFWTNELLVMAQEIVVFLEIADMSLDQTYIEGQSTAEAVAEMLLAFSIAEWFDPPDERFVESDIIPMFAHQLRAVLKSPVSDKVSTIEEVLLATDALMTDRAYFTTTSGHIGFAPSSVQTGDIIVAIVGCRQLLTLRPLDHDRYAIVGECFCNGFMNGEAFLGRLPKDVQVRYRDIDSRILYTNKETKETTTTDPRLDNVALPENWLRVSDEDSPYTSGFYFERHGSDATWFVDPRMTVEEMEERGVPMRDFYIV